MKTRLTQYLLATLCCLCTILAPTHILAANGHNSAAKMLDRVKPAIVHIIILNSNPPPQIFNNKEQQNGRQKPRIGVGTGVIFDAKNGFIATNAHVIQDEKVIIVTLKDGERFHANVVGKDKKYDLAVLHINAKNLHEIKFANSDNVQVGDYVYAIGSPFGLTQSVTSGVVSALNRTLIGTPKLYQSYIQTDAPINMGNSGGALVNTKGQLVGINTAIVTPNAGSIGIGFAIPSNLAKAAIHQLIRFGKITRGLLGVIVQNLTPNLATALNHKKQTGALVTEVVPGSPANKAGLKQLDLVQAVNGVAIKNSNDLHNVMGLMAPNTELTIKVLRNNLHLTLNTSVSSEKNIPAPSTIPFLGGLRLQTFSDLEPSGKVVQHGILVLDASDRSQGMLAGLIPGDTIIRANGKNTPNLKTLIDIAKNSKNRLLIKLRRKNHNFFLVINRNN